MGPVKSDPVDVVSVEFDAEVAGPVVRGGVEVGSIETGSVVPESDVPGSVGVIPFNARVARAFPIVLAFAVSSS
jgi:hypothetical protein